MSGPQFKPGQWVTLPPNQGFVGESDRLKAEIVDEDNYGAEPCIMFPSCGCEKEGMEWPNLRTEPDPEAGGKRHLLCHVCENKMTPCDPPKDAT